MGGNGRVKRGWGQEMAEQKRNAPGGRGERKREASVAAVQSRSGARQHSQQLVVTATCARRIYDITLQASLTTCPLPRRSACCAVAGIAPRAPVGNVSTWRLLCTCTTCRANSPSLPARLSSYRCITLRVLPHAERPLTAPFASPTSNGSRARYTHPPGRAARRDAQVLRHAAAPRATHPVAGAHQRAAHSSKAAGRRLRRRPAHATGHAAAHAFAVPASSRPSFLVRHPRVLHRPR